MRKDTAGQGSGSTTPTWESLEGFLREKAQELIQQILEQEVTELLGRSKSEPKVVVDSPEGYRNGHGKPRRLVTSIGTITVQRPRVRAWKSDLRVGYCRFVRRTKEVGALLPELYLHGLAEGDFKLALRGLLGEEAPLSKATMRRLREGFTQDFEARGAGAR